MAAYYKNGAAPVNEWTTSAFLLAIRRPKGHRIRVGSEVKNCANRRSVGEAPSVRRRPFLAVGSGSRVTQGRPLSRPLRLGARPGGRLPGRMAAVLFLSVGAVLWSPSQGLGQTRDLSQRVRAAEFQPPQPIDELPPALNYEVHLGLMLPIEVSDVCPAEADCILDGGGGVGVFLAQRWPAGLAIGLDYQAWFVDSSSVFELGVLQSLHAYSRFYFMPTNVAHPFVGVGVGGMLFGDTLNISTIGLSAEALAGVELELTESIGLVFSVPVRMLRMGRFVSPRDRVARGEDGSPSWLWGLRLALSVALDEPEDLL